MILETQAPTFIAEGTRLRGDLVFVAAAGVFGLVEGSIEQSSAEWLQIGRGAWVQGAVSAQGPVRVEGKIDGDVISQVRVELTSTATVRGKVTAPSISILAGAFVEGEVEVHRAKVVPLKKV